MLSQFSTSSSAFRPFSIYIGDSVTDLSCLLAADVGIIIQSPRSPPSDPDISHPAFCLLNECGYEVTPVQAYRKLYVKERSEEDRELRENKTNRLLRAYNFEEILQSGMLDDKSWNPREMRRLNIDESEDIRIKKM
jgi:hypothetical protein